MRSFARLTAPAAEPVTLAEAKAHLRVDLSDDDAMIERLIAAAREWVESQTGRALISQNWRMTMDAWPEDMTVALIRPPVQAATAVRTFSAEGIASVWAGANYAMSFGAEPQRLVRLVPAWPMPGRAQMGIEIDLVCGYGALASDVPAALRQAVLLKTAQLYERRGEDPGADPDEALRLIAPFRTVRL
jgi:uncharacterized phiE125 gp8 family phage protein